VEKANITSAVVRALVAAQFPQWADLAVVPVELDGWDNTTFRLGDALSVRLPSADAYVPQIDKEQHWLPILARELPRPIPEPVALGQPADEFPRPWSVYRWIDGEPARPDRISDLSAFASELAGFLTALYAIDAGAGPAAGSHSFHRGGSVAPYDAETRHSIEMLAGEIDRDAVTAVWDAAVASRWERAPVWVHGDVTASNLLVADGRLRAVIDFGCSAVGDPACDLVMAWTFFTGDDRSAFRSGLALDDATWARGRGWALWKALITLVRARQGGESADVAAHRFGWRAGCHEVVADLVADHATSQSGSDARAL